MAHCHPKHLKGREIGLWYKQKAKEKRSQQMGISNDGNVFEKKNDSTIISSLSISRNIITKTNEILNSVTDNAIKPLSIEFEKYFKKRLNTTFENFIEEELKTHNKSLDEYDEADGILRLYSDVKDAEQENQYKEALNMRKKLPIFEKHDIIIKNILDNQIVLVSGDTGCGKTTQIPQFILDYYINNKKATHCNIFCTQPRRIAAITVAERVAWERAESLGVSVGYQIRLESVLPRVKGSITYCTVGILLRKMENDPLLKDISHVVLDEIHERDVDTDILLTLLKKIHLIRKDLRIILMSATFCTEAFSKYFNDCPIIEIHGALHSVNEYYLEDVLEEIKFQDIPNIENSKKIDRKKSEEFQQFIEPYARSITHKYSKSTIKFIQNYVSEEVNIDLIQNLIFHIIRTKSNGAILVFLPGYDKISNLHRKITESKFYQARKIHVYPLHSMMPTTNQKSVFLRPPEDYWKVILSTIIAETSITIDDVVYVIDSGKTKVTDYDKDRNFQTLDEKWVSLANAQQRKGRAGRVRPGICYRLYTRAHEYTFERFPKPEILRTKLDGIVLRLKMLRINNVENFMLTMIDVPSRITLRNSIDLLKRISALDENEKLTPLGLHLARLPVDPQMGKMALMASLFRCIDPVTSIIASMSFKDAFYKPIGKEKQVDEIKRKFASGTRSDHLMLANVIEKFREMESCRSKNVFCDENFLSIFTLNQLMKMKGQFCEILNDASFLQSSLPTNSKDNVNSSNKNIVRAVICAGLYPNVAFLKKIRTIKNRVEAIHTLITPEDGKINFHPSSINSKQRDFKSRFFVYHMKQKSTALYIFYSTMVSPLTLLIFADDVTTGIDSNSKHYLSISNKFKFESDLETSNLIMKLRTRFQLLLQKKALHPSPIDQDVSDEAFLRAIIYLLSNDSKIDGTDSDSEDDT